MSMAFKPKKIALFISAIISSAAFAASAAPASVIVNSSTSSSDRTVSLPTGSDVSYISVSVDDGLVTMGDSTTITSGGDYPDDSLAFNPGYFVKATAGKVDLGNNFTLNYDFDYTVNDNYRGTAVYLYGSSVLKTLNITV